LCCTLRINSAEVLHITSAKVLHITSAKVLHITSTKVLHITSAKPGSTSAGSILVLRYVWLRACQITAASSL
jgi:hypothetical protein